MVVDCRGRLSLRAIISWKCFGNRSAYIDQTNPKRPEHLHKQTGRIEKIFCRTEEVTPVNRG